MEQAPQDARGYYELGRAYRLQHKDQEALGVFEKALTLDPNQYNALA